MSAQHDQHRSVGQATQHLSSSSSSSAAAAAAAPAAGASAVSAPIAARADAAANRLRVVQAEFADAPAEQRQRFLGDEIERALSQIVPADRGAFLTALQERFPSWDAQGGGANGAGVGAGAASPVDGAASGATAAAPQSPTDQRELSDPSFLTTRLCQLAPKMSAAAKESLLLRLRQAGAVPAALDSPWPEELANALRGKVALAEQRAIDPARVIELATMLAELSVGLHALVGAAWSTIAPSMDLRYRRGSLQNTAGRFVASDPAVGRPQVVAEVERLRQLVASLIAGVGEVSRAFARTYNTRFSPALIKEAVIAEGGGGWRLETRCWQKYVELWDQLDEAGIEKEMRDTIAHFAESVMKSVAR